MASASPSYRPLTRSPNFLYYNNFAPAMPAAFPNYWVFFETRAISSSNRESKSFRIADLFDFL